MSKFKINLSILTVCGLLFVGCNDLGVDMNFDAMWLQGTKETPDKVHVDKPYSFILPIVNNRTEEPVHAKRARCSIVKDQTSPDSLNSKVTLKLIRDSTAIKVSGVAKAPGQVAVKIHAYRDDMVSADWTWVAKVVK